MKKLIFLLSAVCLSLPLCAQRMDGYWLLGYENDGGNPIFGGSRLIMDETGIVSATHDYRKQDILSTFAAIADPAGKLLFYTNGDCVFNTDGDSIAKLYHTVDVPISARGGADFGECAMILPMPDDTSLFCLIHFTGKYIYGPTQNVNAHSLYLSLLDRRLNGGKGGLVYANQPLIDDTLAYGLNAVRHANGRDWWVVVPTQRQHQYYRLLLSPSGTVVDTLTVAGMPPGYSIGLYQSVFTRDGSRYIRSLSSTRRIHVIGFDRCKGGMALETVLASAPSQGSYWSFGLAVSPGGKLLYTTQLHDNYQWIHQYDLGAADVAASRLTVATHDGQGGMFGGFGYAYLAPDDHIYVVDNTNSLTVITNPDVQGVGCGVSQHSVPLPTINGHTVPHYPNLYLGALAGSGCDTLASLAGAAAAGGGLRLVPNPARSLAHLHACAPVGSRILLHDALGQPVLDRTLGGGECRHEIDLRGLPPGLYLCTLSVAAQPDRHAKLIVSP